MVKDLILVGRFGAPHGVRGELRLKSFTSDPRAIGAYKPLFDAEGARQFTIASLRLVKGDMLVAQVDGVTSRDSAAALTNLELFVPRAALPEAAEEEFYLADLIGLDVSDAGETIGQIIDVLNFGGGDILEIARGEGGETLLLPFTKEVVPVVDLKGRRVSVVLPDEIEIRGDDLQDSAQE
ncbi:MAG TPA: ribosome maturation factor RimM [Beijerinckia sp.]|jgi:16S rRNA processing protein RimM|nr:ribosome maturation factor RimM [Beijerinckia sp.]